MSNWKEKWSICFALTALLVSCNQAPTKTEPTVVQAVPDTAEHFKMPEIPDTVSFCGQRIDLTTFDAKERLDRELLVNTYYHSSTLVYFKRANRFFPMLERLLAEENMHDDMKYLCLIESGLAQAVSPSGAKGFWQFMPAAAEQYGLNVNREIDERLHVEKSTRAACAYLKDAHTIFNDWALTAAAYNRGMGGIRSDLESQQVTDYLDLDLNNETSRYFFRIIALKLIFENPEAYNFYLDGMYVYEPWKTRKIEVTSSIPDLVSWSIENGSNYHQLSVLNPWILGRSLTVKNQPITIELPSN